MSGHSKWSKVKHQKAQSDALKSSAFTKASHAITVAVREGEGIRDPASNFRLRLAIDNARRVNMPKETIERAIERAKIDSDLEPFLYEGYGPGGVAIMVEGVTNNKQRTANQVKHLFDRFAGSLAGPGSVGYLFSRVGAISIGQGLSDQLFELALGSGADHIEDGEGECVIYTSVRALYDVSQKLIRAGAAVREQKIVYRPIKHLEVNPQVAEKTSGLLKELAALDDVRDVYSNI